MLAARMYGYKLPLVVEEVKRPEITDEQVLVRVEAAGLCRTDFQLVDGYFKESLNLAFPAIPGHEIGGTGAANRCGSDALPRAQEAASRRRGWPGPAHRRVWRGWAGHVCRSVR